MMPHSASSPRICFINAVRSRISSAAYLVQRLHLLLRLALDRHESHLTDDPLLRRWPRHLSHRYLFDFTYGRTNVLITLTSCPSFAIFRAQWCAPPQASIPTRPSCSCDMNGNNCRRRSWRSTNVQHFASTP